MASAILVELNIRLTVLVVETARLERRGVNDKVIVLHCTGLERLSSILGPFVSNTIKQILCKQSQRQKRDNTSNLMNGTN